MLKLLSSHEHVELLSNIQFSCANNDKEILVKIKMIVVTFR